MVRRTKQAKNPSVSIVTIRQSRNLKQRGLGAPQSPAWRQAFRRQLLSWYRIHARDLPWRGTRDPYAVWISEVMLQQTQVATVVPYYHRFLERFPTIQALATAREDDVLRLWEGLGYYRRARQVYRAAHVIMAEHGGRFPLDAEAVRRLPGIGRYTTGAILSIACDAQPHTCRSAACISTSFGTPGPASTAIRLIPTIASAP